MRCCAGETLTFRSGATARGRAAGKTSRLLPVESQGKSEESVPRKGPPRFDEALGFLNPGAQEKDTNEISDTTGCARMPLSEKVHPFIADVMKTKCTVGHLVEKVM